MQKQAEFDHHLSFPLFFIVDEEQTHYCFVTPFETLQKEQLQLSVAHVEH